METTQQHETKLLRTWLQIALARINTQIAENKSEWLDGFLRGQKSAYTVVLEGLLEKS